MKCINYFFYVSLFFVIHVTLGDNFFHLERSAEGTKIPILKLVNLIPTVKNTPLKDAQLEDVYVQAVAETPAVNAHIELLGKIKLKTSLPGLQNIGDLDLSVVGKLFSAFGRGSAPVSSLAVPDNDLSKAALAIFSEIPEGFIKRDYQGYKNAYFEIGKQKPHMILQVGSKYVMFTPDTAYFNLPEQTVKKYIEEMPNTPIWKKLITAPKQTVAQIEREEAIEKTSISPEQQAEAIEAEIKQLEAEINRPGQSAEVIKKIEERARELKLEIKTMQLEQKVMAQSQQLEELARPKTYPALTETEKADYESRFEKTIKILQDKQEQTTDVNQRDDLTKRIRSLKGEQVYFRIAQNKTENFNPRNLPMLIENEQFTKQPPAPAPVPTTKPQQAQPTQLPQLTEFPPALKELQQDYDLYIRVLKEPKRQTQETQTLLNRLVTERDAIGKPGYTPDALADFMVYTSKSSGKPENRTEIKAELEESYQKQLRKALSIPEEPKQPTPQIKLRQDIIQDTITALEKLSQNDVTTSLITKLKSEKETLGTLSTLPEESATLIMAQGVLKQEARKQLQPLTSTEIASAKQQANDTLEELQNMPKASQTLDIVRAIRNLKHEIVKLDLQQSVKDLRPLAEEMAHAKELIAEATPSKPIPSQAKVPPIEEPKTPALKLRQAVIQDTISALEKLPQDDKTTSLITKLKSEKERLATFSTLPEEKRPLALIQAETLLEIRKQLPPSPTLTPDQIMSAKKQADDALTKLKNIPENLQTREIQKTIIDLSFEIKRLESSEVAALPFLAEEIFKAKELIASLPAQKVPLKEQLAATKERIKTELAIAKKELTATKEKIVSAAERAKQTIAALPGQAKEKIVSAKEKAAALAEDIQEEYKAIRFKLNQQINILNAIISERTSEITRVGAALFLITLQNPNYRPFQNIKLPDLPPIDVPGIKDIELNNTELGVFLAPPQVFSIWAQGTGRVINIPLLAKVLFNYEKTEDPTTRKMVDNTGVVLQAGLPEAWKFSDSFPEMKSFDRLVIKRAYAYISTINYIDYSIPTQLMPAASIAIANVPGRPTVGMLPGIAIRPGLSLYGEINLRKLIPEIFDHLNFVGMETASLYGTISNKPENCQLGIGLPDLIKIENSPFKLGGVWAEIHAKNLPGIGFEPEVSVVIALVIQPSPKDETLTFTARASSDVVSGMVAFSMQGFWNDALGIEGLSIGDLAIQLHADYKAVLSGVPITGFGFTGTIKFGTQVDSPIIKLASLYATTSAGQEVAVQGKLDGTISTWQIIDGCKSLAVKKAQQDKKSTKDVEENYNKILNNTVAKQLGNIAIRNVDMKVAPSTVRIGEFFIMQGFTAKGELTLLGVTAGLDFNLGQSGLTATGYLSPIKIGEVFSLTGTGKTKKYGIPDDAATMSLALNFVEQHFVIAGKVTLLGISQETNIFIDADGINCSISGKLYNLFDASVVLKSRGDITHPDLYFKASMQQAFRQLITDQIKKSIQESAQDSVNKITAAQNDVDNLNKNIADLDRQINEHQTRIDQLGKNFIEGLKNSPEIVKLGLELTGLKTAQAGAVASRDTAKGVLEGAKRWVMGSDIIAQNLINFGNVITVDLRDVAIESSIQDLAKGLLPHYTSTAVVFGKTIKLDMQLDFSSPEKAEQSRKAIGQQILTSLQTMFK